ncbi:MAG: LrgB family protein [Lachnospiraceae bacterium]|nr:LrgB family protein [Lachnospiraceae bacterium]
MKEFIVDSAYFGAVLTLLAYGVGVILKKRVNIAIFNPLLISIIIVISVVLLLKVDYKVYKESADVISYLLTPATVSLAIPLYEQVEALKNNIKAIMLGIGIGSITSVVSVLALSLCFGFTHEEYASFLPKSITTAIGMDVSAEIGGYVSLTIAAIVLTGILGNVLAEPLCKLFKIHEPVAKGVAIGTASHALGTAKAIELGEVEGAISGLSIVVCGLFTVVWCGIFSTFI